MPLALQPPPGWRATTPGVEGNPPRGGGQPPPGWRASELAFSARDVQFFGNCHRTSWKVSSQYRDPFAVHAGTVAARVGGIKYCEVAEKGELSVKTRYSCSTSTPVVDLIHALRHGCPNAACRNRATASLRETKSSHAHVEHLHTFVYGHSHYGPVHHRRRFQRRF